MQVIVKIEDGMVVGVEKDNDDIKVLVRDYDLQDEDEDYPKDEEGNPYSEDEY